MFKNLRMLHICQGQARDDYSKVSKHKPQWISDLDYGSL